MRRRQSTANTSVERDKRLCAVREKLLAAVGLTPPLSAADELRIETACWTQMAIENQRNAIASGRLVDIADLERATTALNALLPSPSHELNIRFIDGSDVCVKCKAPLPPKEEREPVKAEAPALQRVPAPPTPAPAPPANVVALHKDIHASARHN